MKTILRQAVEKAVHAEFPETSSTEITFNIETTNNPEHGDYATNAATQLSKTLKRNPRDIAHAITSNILAPKHEMIEKVEIAGPGFINITLKKNAFQSWLGKLLKDNSVLKSTIGAGRKAMVEFVSANPTGPLHIGHGRGAAIGDSVAAILEAAGYRVTREYYVNDAGNQMNNLAKSIYSRYCEMKGKDYPFPEDGYKGEYIADVAKVIEKEFGDELLTMEEKEALTVCRYLGGKTILDEIDTTLRNLSLIHL